MYAIYDYKNVSSIFIGNICKSVERSHANTFVRAAYNCTLVNYSVLEIKYFAKRRSASSGQKCKAIKEV